MLRMKDKIFYQFGQLKKAQAICYFLNSVLQNNFLKSLTKRWTRMAVVKEEFPPLQELTIFGQKMKLENFQFHAQQIVIITVLKHFNSYPEFLCQGKKQKIIL